MPTATVTLSTSELSMSHIPFNFSFTISLAFSISLLESKKNEKNKHTQNDYFNMPKTLFSSYDNNNNIICMTMPRSACTRWNVLYM